MKNDSCNEVEALPDKHAVELTAWDVPPATVAGERFKVSVGVRCSGGCDLGGHALNVFDQEGALAGTAKLGHDVWPGTDALYVAEIEVSAPLQEGSHRWEVRTAEWDPDPPHATGSFPIGVRVVSSPDCEVTIRAVDREQRAPITGARVVMHPYRAVTDENGIAKIKVTRGEYDILVSGSKYLPVCTSIVVIADASTSVELDIDRPWEPPDEASESWNDDEAEIGRQG